MNSLSCNWTPQPAGKRMGMGTGIRPSQEEGNESPNWEKFRVALCTTGWGNETGMRTGKGHDCDRWWLHTIYEEGVGGKVRPELLHHLRHPLSAVVKKEVQNVAKNHGFPGRFNVRPVPVAAAFATVFAQAYVEPSCPAWRRQVKTDADRTADVRLHESSLSQVSCCLQKSWF